MKTTHDKKIVLTLLLTFGLYGAQFLLLDFFVFSAQELLLYFMLAGLYAVPALFLCYIVSDFLIGMILGDLGTNPDMPVKKVSATELNTGDGEPMVASSAQKKGLYPDLEPEESLGAS